MNQIPEEKFNKRRLISSYFSVVVSISLVLFLTGILGVLLVNSKKVADHFKEQIVMTIYVKDAAKEIQLKQLQKTLRLMLLFMLRHTDKYLKHCVVNSKDRTEINKSRGP